MNYQPLSAQLFSHIVFSVSTHLMTAMEGLEDFSPLLSYGALAIGCVAFSLSTNILMLTAFCASQQRSYRYYRNLQMGLPVDFYEGRHDPDHTPWLLYFVETMARAACELQAKAKSLYETASPETVPWERLPRTSQQLLTRLLARVLDGVEAPFVINPSDIEFWFGISDRTSREWLKQWTEDDFIVPIKTASGARIRSYELAQEWIETCFKIRTSVSENNGS